LGIIVAFQDAIIIIIERFAVLLAYAVSVQTHFLAEEGARLRARQKYIILMSRTIRTVSDAATIKQA